MREIKFRAWIQKDEYDDSEPPEMEMCYDLAFDEYLPVNDLLSGVEHLMQYTGLKDKNGKEIYEGDIVDGFWNNTPVKGEVNFREGMFGVDDLDSYSLNRLVVKVIGNIYENPNLLKESEGK